LIAWSIVWITMSPFSAAAQDGTQQNCLADAFNNYNRENLAILQSAAPVLSVEAVIGQRRLEEKHCLQVAQCLVRDASNPAQLVPFEVEFSKCLRDESVEKEK
jgi:hypothetical protein